MQNKSIKTKFPINSGKKVLYEPDPRSIGLVQKQKSEPIDKTPSKKKNNNE